MKLKRFIPFLAAILLSFTLLAACAPSAAPEASGGISIVSSVFPSYEFARQITAGTNGEV